jgi:hypothetical protein
MADNGMLVLQSCTVALRAEHGLCSKTSVQSSDERNEIFTIKIVGDLVRIKQEDEPIAISFSSIKDEPEVSPQTFHQYLGLLTYLLTPWNRVLLEKLTGFAASQEIPRIYGT